MVAFFGLSLEFYSSNIHLVQRHDFPIMHDFTITHFVGGPTHTQTQHTVFLDDGCVSDIMKLVLKRHSPSPLSGLPCVSVLESVSTSASKFFEDIIAATTVILVKSGQF